jgi:hypothetical protein
VQRDGEFDNAEASAKMPAGDGNRVDGFLPQFAGNLLQLRGRELSQIGGNFDVVE